MIFGTFRSTIADSRRAVAGARDVGAKEGVAKKENHTYDRETFIVEGDDTEHYVICG